MQTEKLGGERLAIRKMKFVSIVGKLDHFDEFVSDHIIDSSLHLENALNIITLVRGILPFSNDESKSDLLLKSCASLLDFMHVDYSPAMLESRYSSGFVAMEEIERKLGKIDGSYRAKREECEQCVERLRDCGLIKDSLENIMSVTVNVEHFFNLEFVKFRFGKVPKQALRPLEIWAEELDMVLIPMSSDDRDTWLIYFTPASISEKVDGIVSSMQFERTRLSDELSGTPQDALETINRTIGELTAKIEALRSECASIKEDSTNLLLRMYYSLIRIGRNHEVRRNAVHTENSFYICGWIPDEGMDAMAAAIANESSGTFVEEEPSLIRNVKPPTELKNRGAFKFFEIFVKMYGLPSYSELDPTAFIAVTYFLMFGVMFGDVGQGLLIAAAGLFLMRRKFGLAGIFVCIGVSSTLFGFVYGSVFGNEELIRGLIRPMEDTNTLLLGGVAVGVMFMLAATVMNVVNGLKEKDLPKVLLDRNGVAGFVFYWAILGTAVYYVFKGKYILPIFVIAALVIVPFLFIFFKEPIERLIEKKSFLPKEKGMFFVQGFFEMVDMLLSMASNTISFIRVGAFALNHVGLFMAFRILSDMAGGAGSVAVNIFANLLIIVLEGLIVGIQCLRLEYYELFSRFFRGDGKPYKPLSRSIM
jgi:V/A-type H+-transporting ATPase subunit I